MVEFYQPKKRRGIAGQFGRSTRVVDPKPYWPGLEIEEKDGEKVSDGNNNAGINGNDRAVESTIEAVAKESGQKDMGSKEESKAIDSSASLPTKDSNKSNTKRSLGDLSTFRSRKRKRKLSVHRNASGTDVPSQTPKFNAVTEEKQEGGSNTAKLPTETPTAMTVCTANGVIENCEQTSGMATQDSAMENAVDHDKVAAPEISTKNHATAKTAATTENRTSTSPIKMNDPNNNTDDQSSVPSSDTRSTGATPRALVKFLVQKKFPILDKVVSDIRDVLFGMVYRSPALLHKHLVEAAASSSQSSHISTTDNGEISNGYNNASSQGGTDHAGTSESFRKLPPQDDSMSKFQDICQRQEKLLDRISEMELAAAKREELFSKQIQEQKKALQEQKVQHECRQEEDSAAKLRRDYKILEEANESLRMKLERTNKTIERYRLELQERDSSIEELEESKRLIQSRFQSRFKEQFRVIEKHISTLKVERAENEKLRKRIVLMKNDSLRSTVAGAEKSASSLVDDETPALSHGGTNEHHAFSHRIRHRQTNGQQQKNLCSLQSANNRDDITIPSSPTPAYNPRIRRVARAKDNS